MRPISRRDDPSDLDHARRLVSAAERQALERAEQLRQQAEGLLGEVMRAGESTGPRAQGSPSGDAGSGSAPLDAHLAGLRAEVEAAGIRADSHAEELARLRAEQHQLSRRLDRLQTAIDGAADGRAHPGSRRSAAVPPPALALASPLAAVPEPDDFYDDDAVLAAAREAEELLSAAMAAVEREMSRSAAIRAEAERIRSDAVVEAERLRADAAAEAADILAEARAEAQTIRSRARDEGRADGRASLEEARRRLAEETAGLRIAMDQTWSTLEKLIGSPGNRS